MKETMPSFNNMKGEKKMFNIENLRFSSADDFINYARQNTAHAEDWLNWAYANHESIKGKDKKYEAWQRELLRAFCDQGDEVGAKRVIEATKDPKSREGRIKKFESVFEKKCQIGKTATPDIKVEQGKPIANTDTFRAALSEGRTDEAEKWLTELKEAGEYKTLSGAEFEKFLAHRQSELKSAEK